LSIDKQPGIPIKNPFFSFLTVFFFICDNPAMQKSPRYLEVEVRILPDLQVIHHLLLFRSSSGNPDKVIRPAFGSLRQRVIECGLDPDSLLHIGVPELDERELVSYDCCIEFPLLERMDVKTLSGGRYAVLTVEKNPSKISPAIRAFRGDYLPDHGMIIDEERPVYENYFKDTLEYCVPIR
jgi:DNA gyrase inhibitor GyrI